MSATTATAPHPHAAAPTGRDTHLTFGRLLRSEWIKLWTLRSTIWTLSITVVVMVGLVTLVTALSGVEGGPSDGPDGGGPVGPAGLIAFTPSVNAASLAVVVLGILTITGEYTTGMIRSSLTAEPRRTPVLAAKAVVLGGSILATAAVAVGLSYLVELITIGSDAVDLGTPEAQRVVGGSVLYLVVIALFAFAVGALLRHSAAAMATVLGLLLVVEPVLSFIPWEPLEYITPFLPSSAGSLILQPDGLNDMMAQMSATGVDLTAWQGFGVLVAWVVVLYVLAAVLLKKRDA